MRNADGTPKAKVDAAGKPVPFKVEYPEKDEKGNFLTHQTPASVVAPHNFSWIFIQATVAILILVGFESVTARGEKRRTPSATFPSRSFCPCWQGLFCYLFEYFAANYFLNSGYHIALSP